MKKSTTPDCIGFDLDCALARYKAPALYRLVYASLTKALVEVCGIPDDLCNFHADKFFQLSPGQSIPNEEKWITELCDRNGFSEAFLQKGLIFDFRTGDLIKLSADGHVLRGVHGMTILSAADINRKYNSSVWEDFPLLLRQQKHPHAFIIITQFDLVAQLTLCQCVASIDQRFYSENTRTLDESPSYFHLYTAHMAAFNHIFDNVNAFPSGRGGFFAAIKQNPSTYLYKRPHVFSQLRLLRDRGVVIFLATNSHVHFAEFVLRYISGTDDDPSLDYRNSFDLTFFNTMKPAFFSRSTGVRVMSPDTFPIHTHALFYRELEESGIISFNSNSAFQSIESGTNGFIITMSESKKPALDTTPTYLLQVSSPDISQIYDLYLPVHPGSNSHRLLQAISQAPNSCVPVPASHVLHATEPRVVVEKTPKSNEERPCLPRFLDGHAALPLLLVDAVKWVRRRIEACPRCSAICSSFDEALPKHLGVRLHIDANGAMEKLYLDLLGITKSSQCEGSHGFCYTAVDSLELPFLESTCNERKDICSFLHSRKGFFEEHEDGLLFYRYVCSCHSVDKCTCTVVSKSTETLSVLSSEDRSGSESRQDWDEADISDVEDTGSIIWGQNSGDYDGSAAAGDDQVGRMRRMRGYSVVALGLTDAISSQLDPLFKVHDTMDIAFGASKAAVAFVGDHLHGEVVPSHRIGWMDVAVVEELETSKPFSIPSLRSSNHLKFDEGVDHNYDSDDADESLRQRFSLPSKEVLASQKKLWGGSFWYVSSMTDFNADQCEYRSQSAVETYFGRLANRKNATADSEIFISTMSQLL